VQQRRLALESVLYSSIINIGSWSGNEGDGAAAVICGGPPSPRLRGFQRRPVLKETEVPWLWRGRRWWRRRRLEDDGGEGVVNGGGDGAGVVATAAGVRSMTFGKGLDGGAG
jgi:hypothetical protein